MTKFEIRTAREGTNRAIYINASNADATMKSTEWAAFDGNKYSKMFDSMRNGHATSAPSGTISKAIPNTFKGLQTLDQFLGIGHDGQYSLSDLLKAKNARIIGEEPIGKAACIRIDLGRHQKYVGMDEPIIATTVWIDETAGFLPRMIRNEFNKPDGKRDTLDWEFEVLDFQKITASGKTFAIPSRAIARNRLTEFSLGLMTARINEPIPNEVFHPEFPEGTKIFDELGPGKFRTEFVGGKEKRIRSRGTPAARWCEGFGGKIIRPRR